MMLRYTKRINEHFFVVDTPVATLNAGKLIKGYTRCRTIRYRQGICVCHPGKFENRGSPGSYEAVCTEDWSSRCGLSKLASRRTKIPWSSAMKSVPLNKSSRKALCWQTKPRSIELIKEDVRQDVWDSNNLLAFWDYCVEWPVRINNLTAENLLFKLCGTNAHVDTIGMTGVIFATRTSLFLSTVKSLDECLARPTRVRVRNGAMVSESERKEGCSLHSPVWPLTVAEQHLET